MRPKIICHMISSVDGRLLTERWTAPNGEPAAELIHRVYDAAAAQLDNQGWMIGRASMTAYVSGERRPQLLAQAVNRSPYKGEPAGRKLAVAFDPSGKLILAGDDIDGDHAVAILSERVEDSYLETLRAKGVSYLFSGPDGADLAGAMTALGAMFDVNAMLLQGGGTINGAFLAAGLIDEFSTLIFPFVDGMAGVPSIVDYRGTRTAEPASGQRLQLIGSETLDGGVVWLRHKVIRDDVA